MNPRLAKLNEQRDLILKHLHWIDQEIAAETPTEAAPGQETIAAPPTTLREKPPEKSAPTPDPDSPATTEIPVYIPDLEEEANVKSLKNDVRKGCLIYFGIACLILAAGVALIYVIYN